MDETRDAMLSVRVPTSLKDALSEAAADERRKLGDLVNIALTEWLEIRREAASARPRPAPRRR
jgi:hypothetical protein